MMAGYLGKLYYFLTFSRGFSEEILKFEKEFYNKICVQAKALSLMCCLKTWCMPRRSSIRYCSTRRKIRLLEGNAKCRHLKELNLKGTLRQVFISLWPRTLYPYPLPYTLFTCIVYTTVYFFTQGRGGVVEPGRREEGQQFTKLTVSPVYKL